MQMDQPAPPNALDANRQGRIGRAADRVDGRLKVTGSAPYAYEVAQSDARDAPAYGFVLGADIACGRIADIDTREAESAPGVLLVMTHCNAPAQAAFKNEGEDRFARPLPCLADDQVRHHGDAVAFVVASTFEQARAAARLLRISYENKDGSFVFEDKLDQAFEPESADGFPPDSSTGQFEPNFGQAAVQFDQTYRTPIHIHAQMEPHASLAWWEGDRVVVHCSTQVVESAQKRVAATLMIDTSQVRIVSRYIGGGFGGKLPVFADVILTALAARELGRPVKTAPTRQQMFDLTTHRGNTRQRVRLGADEQGVLSAIGHESWSQGTPRYAFCEPATVATRSLYAGAHRMTRQRTVALDLPVADSCRAPGEAVGLLALESAMDELAHQLAIDPIELRIRNEPAQDPEKKLPYSSRQLIACMQHGAKRFGWDQRQAQPGQVREGRWLIGIGMSAASRGNLLQEAHAEVMLRPDGVLQVRTAMTDLGTGSYTVFSQIAAEMLGIPLAQVSMELGDSDFPPSAGSGGSYGAASTGSAIFQACSQLRAQLAGAAGIDAAEAGFADGHISGGGKTMSLISLAALAGKTAVVAKGMIEPGKMEKSFSQQAYGAFFAEVAVDTESGEVWLRRMLGVFAVGRILNAKTARSQALGGLVWGVGELGISGADAALANVVSNACGVRIRDFPLTLDKVLAGLR